MAGSKDEAPELLPGMPEDYYDSPMAKYMNSSVHSTPEDKENSKDDGEQKERTPLP